MTINDNVLVIQKRMKEAQTQSARHSQPNVTLICVSKYHSVDEAKEVYDSGVRHFAENRPEGLIEKKQFLPDDIVWHYIGSLQTRKVKQVINRIDYLHSLDRLKLAKEIQKRAIRPINCFIQVNVSGELSKHGLHPDDVKNFIQEINALDKINVVGLMTMAPKMANENEIRQTFVELRQLSETLTAEMCQLNRPLQLSMGMSNDYDIAIEEGANFVRIGQAFFKG